MRFLPITTHLTQPITFNSWPPSSPHNWLALWFGLIGCLVFQISEAETPPLLQRSSVTAEIITAPLPIDSLPHDPTFFTQGLLYDNGILYESTGLYGESKLIAMDASTGQLLRSRTVSQAYFAEGLALRGDELYQLTWKSGRGLVYDKHSFALLREFSYPGEGWGLTSYHDGFLFSDGTSTIRQVDHLFNSIKYIYIKYNNYEITNINEIELINNRIWANIWQTQSIVVINPSNGVVEKRIDFDLPLPEDRHKNDNVLNGIAYDKNNSKLYITGKNYKKIYIYNINDFN